MARVARLVALLAALVVVLTPRPGVAADDDSARAEQSFREGNQAFAAGDFHAAFAAYRAAWSLKKSFDIACNLGRTEVELSLSRDAAEHLDYCLRMFSVSSRDDVRDANKRFRDLFERVRREVAALSVEVRPSGAEITVDGASYGSAPLGRDLFLDPGAHRVRASLSGFQDEERVVQAEAGGSLRVSLALVSQKAALAPLPAAPSAPAPAAESGGIEPRTIVLLAGAGLSFVALGVGVAFTLDANSTHERAAKVGRSIHESPAGSCVNPMTPDCTSLTDLVAREQNSRDAADIALGTGALIGAATLTAWLLIPDSQRSRGAARVRALPWLDRSVSGIALSGAY